MYPFRTRTPAIRGCDGEEIPAKEPKADARTRTGDPFITSEIARSGGIGRRVAESGAEQGESSRRALRVRQGSVPRFSDVWALIGHWENRLFSGPSQCPASSSSFQQASCTAARSNRKKLLCSRSRASSTGTRSTSEIG